MYKLTTKNGVIIFAAIDDLMIYVVGKANKLFLDGAYIKISEMEDTEV